MLTSFITLVLAAVVLTILAIAMAVVLGWANQAFHVEVDQKVIQLDEALPGANCGGCGYVGCAEYAEAVAKGEATVDLCAPGGAGCAQALAEIMGVSVDASLPYRAVIHCAADRSIRKKLNEYRGEQTCVGANLVADVQGCVYGCLGLGDCKKSCKYGAIEVVNGLAKINYDKCVGCKACAKVCPRNIISMVPFKTEQVLVVGCSNKDFGPDVRKVCDIGCIGCKACSRISELFSMDSNLPSIDYDNYDPNADFEKVIDKCPMQGLVWVGKPTEKDKAAVAGEEVPERVEADFKTTVDETEWRG